MSHPPCYTRHMNKQLEELEGVISLLRASLRAELARDPRAAIKHMGELRHVIRLALVANEQLLASPALKKLA